MVVVVIAALIAVAGVGVAFAVLRRSSDASTPTEGGQVRVRALVGVGSEQALLRLTGGLGLMMSSEAAAYGQLYIEPATNTRVHVRSRSEIDRGFRAVIDVRRIPAGSTVEYAIVRLPSDEALHARVLRFELTLIEAIRSVDPHAEVRLRGDALRALYRTQAAAR